MIIGLFRSKILAERILFANSITNISIVIIAILASFESRDSYIDIAIIYSILSFLAMKAFLNYHSKPQ
jgi:multicomponent Na+:H+ antiporter subunit F